MLGLGGGLAGLIGGVATTISAALLAGSSGYGIWFPFKALVSLVLGSSAAASAGLAAAPVLLGLLIQLVLAAILGALFAFVTRGILRLPSDFGIPVLSGLVFGLLVWLAAYLLMPAIAPQLLAAAAPAFIIVYIVYGTATGLAHGLLRPQPYTATD
jgi:hypothetical protein